MAAAGPTNWQSKALLAGQGVSKGSVGVILGKDALQAQLSRMLTLVLGVLKRTAQDLEWASHVESVVAREQGEQHLDLFNGAIGAVSDCTHLE
jgi:hypothetical protein